MTQLPELLDALNKAGYIGDDIRCEDNEDVIKDYNKIIWKYKNNSTKANKVYEMLLRRWYIHDDSETIFGFILWYFYFSDFIHFYFLKDN